MKKNIAPVEKKRNWATVCYPESVPENWLEILKLSGVPVAISPLHDRDLEADEKTPKKPHWHVMMVYPGPKSPSSMKSFCSTFGGIQPVPLEGVRGYYRYLTHKDNPEKVQYDEKDIQLLNGFSVFDFIELTRNEVFKIKKAVLQIIREHGFVEYSSLVDWLDENGTVEHFEVAINNTLFFDKYLTSRRHTAETSKVQKSMAGLAREATD